MPLPGGITTCTLTGTYLSPDGTALGGQVSFTPSSVLPDPGTVVISALPVVARLQPGTGAFSAVLACTDNAALHPAGWMWHAIIQVPGAEDSFYFLLPSTLGGSADISSLTPAGSPPSPDSAYVTSVNGETGAVTISGGGGIATGVLLTDVSGGIWMLAILGGDLTALPVMQDQALAELLDQAGDLMV